MYNQLIHSLTCEMIRFDQGDPGRIQHFLKVHSFARIIGIGENLDEDALFTLEAAALAHDIGIRPAEEKYGSCNGKLQEQEGPAPAKEMLTRLGFEKNMIERVCFLIAHHHTYDQVDGIDYRILLEADALVNLYEGNVPKEGIAASLASVFRTGTGIRLCKTMFTL